MRVTLKDLSIFQVADLLERIESKSKVVVIRELKIKRTFRDKERLDVDLAVATFHDPSAAKPGDAAAGKDGGAAAPAPAGEGGS
jgi:hypothetical protein